MQKYLKGTFKKLIFKSETDYYIGLFKVLETNYEEYRDYIGKSITFTGYFHELNVEDNYLIYGEFIFNDRYGTQFKTDFYEPAVPEEKDEMVEFLSSDLFKGIGQKKAKAIVDHLGNEALSLIIENKTVLLNIKGITRKNADDIYETLLEYQSSYRIVLSLNELGFSTKDSLQIYKKYQQEVLEVIKTDIYQICEDINEIGFKKVDLIAVRNGTKKDDVKRIKATILYVMREYCNLKSDTYMLNGDIYNFTKKVLMYDMPVIEFDEAIKELLITFKIINIEEKYFLSIYYQAEKFITERIKSLSTKSTDNKDYREYIKQLENLYAIEYSKQQKTAISEALKNNFLTITGGPGTGKTTIIKSIVAVFRDINEIVKPEEVVLLAPTGRASKRLSTATTYPASTIHRFLKWNKDLDRFAINEYNQSKAKLVIIDEASMLDTLLFASLLKGLSENTVVILVGDVDQLPSVGAGQVLKDIINSRVGKTIMLDELYRTSDDSTINVVAENTRKSYVDYQLFENADLEFHEADIYNTKNILKEVLENINDFQNKDLQILAPMYKTKNGIDELNVFLQNIYNPKDITKNEIIINGIVYRENDKVIQLVNNADENVFNGDIGYITHIDNNKKTVAILFDDNLVIYNASLFNSFRHAFVISIHKSQGSEFDNIIMIILNEYGRMLYKKLVYTGLTRAKEKLIILGQKEAFNFAVSNNYEDKRKTGLFDFLIEK